MRGTTQPLAGCLAMMNLRKLDPTRAPPGEPTSDKFVRMATFAALVVLIGLAAIALVALFVQAIHH
jgi:hypothetical protein